MVATRAQRSAAAARAALSPEVRRALQSEDVLACVLSLHAVKEGCVHSLASVSKAWRAAWRRRCKDRCRLLRTQIGDFRHAIHVTALANGGAIVADYGHFRLEALSRDGDSQAIYCEQFETPGAIALLGDGTAWMLAHDHETVCLVRWQDEVGAQQPRERWPNEGDEDGQGEFGDPYRRILRHVNIPSLLGEEQDYHVQPYDLAISGDRLLVLCCGAWFGRICVFDSQTGAFLYHIGRGRSAGEADALSNPKALTAHQDLCFVADTYNHVIKIFNFRQRVLVRTIGSAAASDLPCEFDEPAGVAFRDGRLYVSEWDGQRIQILRFANGIHGAVECLQIIPSPNGLELAGLCLSGDRLWCMGGNGGSVRWVPSLVAGVNGTVWTSNSCMHLFTACV